MKAHFLALAAAALLALLDPAQAQQIYQSPVSPAPISNVLAGDVNLNNTANYFDGPSVAQGTSGTWFASGTVTVVDVAGVTTFMCKLWDGTTVIASATSVSQGGGSNISVSLSGFLAAPAANLRISCRDSTAITGLIKASASGVGFDSVITAYRIK